MNLSLQAIGPILTAIGSIVLAIRLEKIIDAILIGINANQKAVQEMLGGESVSEDLEKSHALVRKELNKGKTVLIWGFSAIALGGIVNTLSYFID